MITFPSRLWQWYHKLDAVALRYYKPGSLGFVSLKVLLDTAVFSPLHILGYFAVMNMGDGGSWQDLKKKVSTDFIPTLTAELTVWPAVQAVNFKLVRVEYHLLVVNLLTILGVTCAILGVGTKLGRPAMMNSKSHHVNTFPDALPYCRQCLYVLVPSHG